MSWLDTITKPGFTAFSSRNPTPILSMVPVELFSIDDVGHRGQAVEER